MELEGAIKRTKLPLSDKSGRDRAHNSRQPLDSTATSKKIRWPCLMLVAVTVSTAGSKWLLWDAIQNFGFQGPVP